MRGILLFAILLIAGGAAAKRTIVYGRFNYTPGPVISLQYYASPLDYIEQHNTKLEAVPGKYKEFKFVIDTDIPLNFHLLDGDKWLFFNKYIGPGDSLNFAFADSSIDISGQCEECFAFQTELTEKFYSGAEVNKEYNGSFKTMTPIDFAAYHKKRKQQQHTDFENYFKGKPYPAAFKNQLFAEIDYGYAVNLVQYTFKGKDGKTALLDNSYLAYLKEVNNNNPDALACGRYVQYLDELPAQLWSAGRNGYAKDSREYLYYTANQYEIRDSIARLYFMGACYDLALYQIIHERINQTISAIGTSDFDSQYSKTDNLLKNKANGFTNKLYYARLQNSLRETKERNTPAPDFAATTLAGKPVHLADYKGKVVYIDFWATNCAPCVAELPYTKKMQEKYKDNKDLVLLYVSFDANKAVLQKFLTTKGFSGTHWKDAKGLASDAAGKYNISSLPRYIVVDKKGMLVTTNAPRPSDGPDELLDKVLKEN